MNAIIVGVTSGIGRRLAKVLAEQGYALGITGRRIEYLASLKAELAVLCQTGVWVVSWNFFHCRYSRWTCGQLQCV